MPGLVRARRIRKNNVTRAVYSAIGTSHMFVLPLLCSCYPVSVSDKRHYGYAMGEGVYVCIQVCVEGASDEACCA